MGEPPPGVTYNPDRCDTDGNVTIGSDPLCTIVVADDRYVSGIHALLMPGDEPGTIVIVDCSANGTRVNGRRIGIGRRVVLAPDDRVMVGRTVLNP